MVQTAPNSSSSRGICGLDIIGRQHHSVGSFVRARRQNQRQLGQKIARKRLLENAQRGAVTENDNAVLAHRRTGRGDLYLTGESSQYSNCCFLDGHDVICATSVHGDLDVIRLPRYGGGDSTLTELAGKIQLSESYSVSARYKLKALYNGQAFAVGSPSGTLSIFSTEHASTWCRSRLPSRWKRTVHQDSSSPANPADPQNNKLLSWAPFITNQWQTDTMLEQQTTTLLGSFSSYLPMSPESVLVQPLSAPEWSIKPHADSLWDFKETPSSLLTALAKQDFQGCAKEFVVMDSRTHNNNRAETIASISNTPSGQNTNRSLPEGITALCFGSEFSLLSAHAKIHHAGPKVENSIRLWDLRKSDQPVQMTTLVNPERNNKRAVYGSQFVSFLTPSISTGKVMVTSSSHQNRSTVLHCWLDVGRFQMVQSSGSSWSCIHQRNRNTSVFGTNPDQDFMACYETSSGGDAIHLFDPSTPPHDDKASSNAPRAPISRRAPTSRKRRPERPKSRVASKSSRRTAAKTTAARLTSSSSSSSDDDNEKGDSNDHGTAGDAPGKGQQFRGVTYLGSYRPKLLDRYGLTTHLSCVSVNDSGTAIVGCSYDGDTFVWRGA